MSRLITAMLMVEHSVMGERLKRLSGFIFAVVREMTI